MAEQFNIYQDIATRTNGDIYIGVVGPVRTGKSTFIKNFMDLLIIPNIQDENQRTRTIDELPQSSSGKTIMTTEPKFIPNEAVNVKISDNVEFKTIMIDCVGYMVDGAIGHLENDKERMVKTPWFEDDIPFTQAAELGTQKVIDEHSTVGIVVTTDGSVTELDRGSYVEAEERVINELKQLKKPFVVVLNSTKPFSEEAQTLNRQLSEKYNVPVINADCKQLRSSDIDQVSEKLLHEFPIREIKIKLPKWTESLANDHWLKSSIIEMVKNNMNDLNKLRDVESYVNDFNEYEIIKKVHIDKIDLSEGVSDVDVALDDALFYNVLSETTGIAINSEHKLISLMKKLAKAKTEYDKVGFAFNEVMHKGYGVVNPLLDEIKLEKPEIVKQGNRYVVKFKASAPSVHLIRADIKAEVSPFVGTEKQSQEFVDYFMGEYDKDPQKVWDSEIFGKSLFDLVNESLHNKIYTMPDDAQGKLQQTLQKIVNEGSGGLICIIL